MSRGKAYLFLRRCPRKFTTLRSSFSSSFEVKLTPEGRISSRVIILIKLQNIRPTTDSTDTDGSISSLFRRSCFWPCTIVVVVVVLPCAFPMFLSLSFLLIEVLSSDDKSLSTLSPYA